MTPNKTMSPLAAKGLMALQQAVAKLEQDHRRSGEPMVVWRDGKVVLEIPEPVHTLREGQGDYSGTKGKHPVVVDTQAVFRSKKRISEPSGDRQQPSQPSFETLVDAIRDTHEKSASFVNRTVNTALTFRNWLIGAYIHQYEFRGADKAQYGDQLVSNLAKALEPFHIPATDRQRLYGYLAFFRTYPSVGASLPEHWYSLKSTAISLPEIVQTPSGQSETHSGEIVRTMSGQSAPAENIIYLLSYSHLELLVSIKDPSIRSFYEMECIHGNWSVRSLKRQISSLYFERSGLSANKEKLAAITCTTTETTQPKLTVRDPYVFEFLGIKPQEAMMESEFEEALLDNLQEFLLELGHGFCLEARQKSIVIGNTRNFIDMVFYNRILKCHILVELKSDEFRHEHIGQLNTYVEWYKRNVMAEGENPPVGILLCTQKDHALVEYALAAIDNSLFVSKYLLKLPSKEELMRFMQEKQFEVGNSLCNPE